MVEVGKKVYPSKRDGWLVAVIWLSLVVMVASAIGVMTTPDPPSVRLGVSVLMLALAAFTLWIYGSTHYTLAGAELIIRCGPFRWRVELDSIDEVSPSRNPLSGPAFSLDRLHIKYRGSRMGILISPREKTAFLLDLVSRCPDLKLEGGKVVRSSSGVED